METSGKNSNLILYLLIAVFVGMVVLGLGMLGYSYTRNSESEAVTESADSVVVADAATDTPAPAPTDEEPADAAPVAPEAIIIAQPGIATAVPTQTETPFPTATPTETPIPSETPTATATPTETPTPTVTPTPTRVGPRAQAERNAGIFAGPGEDFGRIGFFVPATQSVVVLGIDAEDPQWIHVIDDYGREGWVVASFFDYETGSQSDLAYSDFRTESDWTPSPTPRPSATPTPRPVTPTPTRPGPTPTPTRRPANTPTPTRPPATATPTRPAGTPTPSGTTDAVAYWNFFGSTSEQGDGTWSAEITVRVPEGSQYRFSAEGATVVARALGPSDVAGYTQYAVTLSQLGCGVAYVNNLTIIQDGFIMVVENEFTGLQGPIYIDYTCSNG